MNITEKIERYLNEMEKAKNPEFSDKKFGKLLKPGDDVLITNMETGKSTERTIDKFNGLEYTFKGMDNIHNLGHSGYEIVDDDTFYVLLNKKRLLKVERLD